MQTIADNPCLSIIIADYYKYNCDENGVWIGKKYVSMPYFSYGSEKAKDAIKSFKHWEYRGFEPISEYTYSDKCSSFLYLKSEIQLQLDDFKTDIRRKIRKAVKNQLTIQSGGNELLDDYYRVYYSNMKELGSPALAKSFFAHLIENYHNGNAVLYVVYFHNQAIASAFLLSYKDFYENTWFASLRSFNNLYSTYLLHWEMIKFSIESKAQIYSFGRSTIGSGVHIYKKQWNTTDIKLYWSFSEARKIEIRKLKIFSKIWKQLPDFIIRLTGHFLAKRIY